MGDDAKVDGHHESADGCRPRPTIRASIERSTSMAAGGRIIAVVKEPRCFGFAYGTLPGYPEQGEAAFVVTTGDDRVVRFGIRAFSRPGDPVNRRAGVLGRGLQSAAMKGYLRAIRKFMDQASPPAHG